mmetsp:Transcript_7959/g.15974  ORF Transcript_7959/g.15974 Transcript_7959/m.15974 type:complete len:233 (-) Transcript_7959:624-1322(-)
MHETLSVVGAWVFVCVWIAHACSIPVLDPFAFSVPARFAESSVVMKVTIVDVLSDGLGSQMSFPDSSDGVVPISKEIDTDIYFLGKVRRFFKGCPPTSRFVVIKGNTGGGGLCGPDYPLGTTYLFFGSVGKLGREVDIFYPNVYPGSVEWAEVSPLERRWILGQQHLCGSVSLCSNGIHSRLTNPCQASCPACANKMNLECIASPCGGCAQKGARFYRKVPPFDIVSGCRVA